MANNKEPKIIKWNEVTEQVKEIIKTQVTQVVYKTWIESLKCSNYEDKTITFEVTEIQKSALRDRLTKNNKSLHQTLIETFNQLTRCVNHINYVVLDKGVNKNMEEAKVITFEEVENRLKNIPLEEYSMQDTIDRYVAYGDTEDFEDIEVQRLLIKHKLAEWLVCSIETVITDQYVINGIISSNLFKQSNYKLLNGRMKSIKIVKDTELPKGSSWLIIKFIGYNKIYEKLY